MLMHGLILRGIIQEFQKCHLDHPIGKFFGQCKSYRCFRQDKAEKRKPNFEQSKKMKERLRAHRQEYAARSQEGELGELNISKIILK
ncbi:hypothetical protein M9H77_37292 [Catharanthus roseus]|uniref:Uncharacterized protein n=1 Tax=Catharanthus roseus TaxID=4058 RepID=A0ACB9ZYH8_CATRO|nr:hypothetical protein M9H77_37292 [Catharanthus roseus]